MARPVIIFDFDGTLINSEPGILKAIQLTVQSLDLPETCVEQWRQMIGLPLKVQLTTLLPDHRRQEADRGVEIYRQYYKEVGWPLCDPFPHIPELVESLQPHTQLAIASSKQRVSILRILETCVWGKPFDPIITPTEVTAPKPDPESIERILTYHQQTPDQAWMIGDTQYDMEMAQRAGIRGLGVTWGVHSEAQLQAAGAHQCFQTPQELQDYLIQALSV